MAVSIAVASTVLAVILIIVLAREMRLRRALESLLRRLFLTGGPMRNANPMMVVVLLTTIVGCTDSDQRLVEMAKEHEKSQAEQSQQMARMQHEVAEGGKKLIEADAKARENLTAMQHDLRTDQAEIGHQRDQLENDRREIAAQRRR